MDSEVSEKQEYNSWLVNGGKLEYETWKIQPMILIRKKRYTHISTAPGSDKI
jgi:DNA polymerase elongation subunit (family B)